MNKIIVALSLMALIGAGCTKTPVSTSQPQLDLTNTDVQTITTDTTQIDQSSDQKPIQQPQAQIKTNPVEDVPVVDIFLGEPDQKLNMEAGYAYFKPNVINAKPGEAVQITFTKMDGTHTFNIDEINFHDEVKQGMQMTFVSPKKPGSYKFYCSVGDHRKKGMEGTLIVK